MKKIKLIMIGTLFIVGSVKSQDNPKFMIGGGISFNKYSSEEDYSNKAINIGFNADLGYCLNEKWIMGLRMGFNYFNYEWDHSDTSYTQFDTKYVLVTPFVRFQNNITDKFKYYIEPNFGVGFILDEDYDYTAYTVGTDVGLLYYVTNNFSLELKLLEFDFNHNKINDDGMDFNFNLKYNLLTPSIGLKYYF